MAHTTQPYKRSLSGSIGAGFGSIMGGSGKQYYILEHKIASRYHQMGEAQEIIVDQVELGRDNSCQVRFDESFSTVSRRHAAIIKSGDKWKLVQLSTTNPTFLNGVKVGKEWYLQNGDEIQLSIGGPKLGFIVPTGKKSTVGSIGLSRRLSLFRQQALRPYKQAITALCILLILAIGGGVYWGFSTQNALAEKGKELSAAIAKGQSNTDSLTNLLLENNRKMKEYEQTMKDLSKKIANGQLPAGNGGGSGSSSGGVASTGEIAGCNPHVFAIVQRKIVLTCDELEETVGEDHPSVIGTGFLLGDGRFVTARHVSESWYFYPYFNSEELMNINVVANNGGKVVAHYTAVSSSGKSFSFTSDQLKCNRGGDAVKTIQLENGMNAITKVAVENKNDWAYYNTGETGGLSFNSELSANLPVATKLEILGFPHGRGAESLNSISPIYSNCQVARQGLDVDGTIMVSNDNTEPGNSGGPVLLKKDNTYQVIGILSGSTYEKGRIVPVSAVK